MASQGQLAAAKVGDRWLLERAVVEQRLREGSHEGRRFSPQNAWALLLLASGEDVAGVPPSVRSRLKRALAREGLEILRPRLAYRAEVLPFNAHPGEISHVLEDPALVRSSISAAGDYDLGLLSGREADGYLPKGKLKQFVASHALEPAQGRGNVQLRLVPKQAWRFLQGRPAAPLAAVALDLAEEHDSRSARAGRQALREIDSRIRQAHRRRR